MSAHAQTDWLLRAGDDVLVLSQRLTEWCGKGPVLEEDMALANVALDLMGQARLWLSYVAELEGQGGDEDSVAFLRDAPAFRNLLLVEQPNGDYADTLMRQFFFDCWHYHRLQSLQAASDPRVAEIAAKSIKEVAYHLRRSGDLVVRLGDGSDESHRRMQASAERLWAYTGEAFVDDEIDRQAAADGVAPLPSSLRDAWLADVKHVFAEATLALPPVDAWMQSGGKQGRHTEHLGYLLAEMQFLQRAYPGAQW
ncbi:MAG: phenylacetate-CoA oxygenase subunit PaaC [Pseudomonadota bacterium]